jgi:myo-inositol catabolism protein IolC
VAHWLREAAGVEGFIGFAIGRTIFWDALSGWLRGDTSREAAVEQIAENYRRTIDVYATAQAAA